MVGAQPRATKQVGVLEGRWYAQLYDKNKNYIEVIIDMRELRVCIENVRFDATFKSARNRTIGRKLFYFTDELAPDLCGTDKPYIRYIAHPFASAARVKGGNMEYNYRPMGQTVGNPPALEILLAAGGIDSVFGQILNGIRKGLKWLARTPKTLKRLVLPPQKPKPGDKVSKAPISHDNGAVIGPIP